MKYKKSNMAKDIASKVVKMLQGGKMPMYQMGGGVTGPDYTQNYYETVQTIEPAQYTRENPNMIQAVGEGRIDAYNFELPSTGMLSDYDEKTKQRLRQTEFGREYLSDPNADIDQQYGRWAQKVNSYIDDNPGVALRAINDAIESGNPNFAILEGMSDDEKLATTKRLMTDKRIGDFHGALVFGETIMPRASFYDPNAEVRQAGLVRSEPLPKYLTGVGGRTVMEGDIPELVRQAEQAGIDITRDTPEARDFVQKFMEGAGMQEKPAESRGMDNRYFADMVRKEAEQQLQSRSTQADERIRRAMEQVNAMKRGYNNGGMVPKKRPVQTEISDAMRAQAYRTEERSSPFRVISRGYDKAGKELYDVSYSPLMNLLRKKQSARAEF